MIIKWGLNRVKLMFFMSQDQKKDNFSYFEAFNFNLFSVNIMF
jgi:hypothetical protein